MGAAFQDIETPRLRLRQLRAEDAPALRRIVTTPGVGRMLFVFPTEWSEAAARDLIAREQFTGRPDFRLAIEDARGTFVGSVGCARRVRLEVFYFLAPAAQGQGYATEAMAAFLAFLFDRFAPDEIAAGVFTDNPASARVLGKLGFTYFAETLGKSAQRLEPAPLSLYRLTKSQFESRPT